MKTKLSQTDGYQLIHNWMAERDQQPFDFQKKAWSYYGQHYSGLLVAPTGFGKTYAIFLAVLIDYMNQPDTYGKGLKLIWITPIRSLAKDLAKAMQEAIDSIGLDWKVSVRNGDTSIKEKALQKKNIPDILLLTPESLHLLLAQKDRDKLFENLKCIAVDEWHELMGNKRGVMVELALGYLRLNQPKLRIWGITATIGNLDEALDVLIPQAVKKIKITAKEKKKIKIIPVYPDEVSLLPWAGHLGGKLVDKVVPIILNSRSTLIFTNTRSQSEMWYQLLLNAYPDFAGLLALHHGSIDHALRQWIEESLSDGLLKAVVCTSSLDLGVDFKPVDTVIQIGSSKGIARFLQRAGRSGHSPHEVSKIYFVPTHSLELIEVAALRQAMVTNTIEARTPLVLTYDVLVQFLVTLALGGGFKSDELFEMVQKTHAFQIMEAEQWAWCLLFITQGGKLGEHYEEFHRVQHREDGLYLVENRRIAMIHRMNIGVIVSDAMIRVKFLSGGYIGMVEEYFISKLKVGDRFILAGRILEYIQIKELTVYVRASKGKAITPSWLGGRLPLSSDLGHFLREKIGDSQNEHPKDKELQFLKPLLQHQKLYSHIPKVKEFLVEQIHTREGYHLFMYPFEGRIVHEVMATVIAYRISKIVAISFSIAMNDYGFELFTDQPIPLDEDILKQLLTVESLMADVFSSINATEMALHKFREIAVISGMVIQTYPGAQRNNKSLQASSSIMFKVLEDFEPQHLLLRQAYTEVFNQQLEEVRLMQAFIRIAASTIIYKESDFFTPLSFPIKVDSLRQSLSSENLATRIEKMIQRNTLKKKKR
ncbi:ligase-associated DNA damage response DEXH box helicase [Flavobacterium sp. HSC-61S13]|uniref:ligase-associated DNA damage response DEXH box helicase n=1 Tax=Flavobacterium sp. HSC-61S13 TaxID=2910963 RepID=UPI0021126191|nr:ligase-associated DNA damage response DEXH box helicase [Flavobacterium sp. HSC-61S13]MCP1996464.1 ATP-dependent Lhr-like helicase [Flavobacterium sp. HSC-61S13]